MLKPAFVFGGLLLARGLLAGSPAYAQTFQVEPAPLTETGELSVALHARSQQASARTERAAWLSVTLPLDRAALPQASPAVTLPATPSAAPDPATDAASTPPRIGLAQLQLLADYARRASAVALGAVGTAAERQRLDGLSSRARSSALLPELRLRVVRNSDQALRWIPTTDDPYRITQADGTGLILEASAVFRLDRLVFAREELNVERLRLHASAARLALEAKVREGLVGLFRARELACLARDDDERAGQVLKLLERFAELDGLTAGWFSQQAAGLGRAVWGYPEAVLGACSPPPPAERPSQRPAPTKAVASLEDSE